MKKLPPARTVLSGADLLGQTGITEKNGDRIIAMLDTWIAECEGRYGWIADESNNALPEHQRTAVDLADAIAKVKKYRDVIQSNDQPFWALAILNVIRAATLRITLDRDLHHFVDHDPLRATGKRTQSKIERRRGLAALIAKHRYTIIDVMDDKEVRRALRIEYEEKWSRSRTTFNEDLKSLYI